jgi:16S rRNA (adenine1518-N6/adenine1519-N6)-dimethyltransferase
MKANKSLGQHFLTSAKALASIISAGELSSSDTVLEIGPGMGALTRELLNTGARVVAVEKDDELYEFLKKEFSSEILSDQLSLVREDILNFIPESAGLESGQWKLIANIPYNITGAILKKFLSLDNQPERMVLLVQREVAKRIVAEDEKESILSISVKAYGKPRYVEMVKAGSFSPPPKVDSAIISIEEISKDFFKHGRLASTGGEGFPEEVFFEILRTGFSSKRKKLSSNLSKLYPKENVSQVFAKLGLDENLRAEDVDIHLWHKISSKLYEKF